MRYRVEVSAEAQKQLSRFPRDVRERMERAIDEFEEKDDAEWSNTKPLKGADWKGRLRKKVLLSDYFYEVSEPRRCRDFRRSD
jgi:mRNA-degrading endonuclease RelE of RelBE toxin-antitoxin system